MDTQISKPPRLPPAWFKHFFWRSHRFLYRLIGERALWTPKTKRGWGALHLTAVGRKSGQQRGVILGYLDDGSTPVVLAMNGWDEGLPAWWLNLDAHPDAVIVVKGHPERPVRARRAEGEERDRLWRLWAEVDEGLTALADSRSAETPVIVFEPREAATDQTVVTPDP
jgi:deazaflavin-dependent oxidoreductase (nitroreductase family)